MCRNVLQKGRAAATASALVAGKIVKTRRLRKRRPCLRPRLEVHLFKVAGEATVIRVNGRRRREGPARSDLRLKYCSRPSPLFSLDHYRPPLRPVPSRPSSHLRPFFSTLATATD